MTINEYSLFNFYLCGGKVFLKAGGRLFFDAETLINIY